MISVIGVDSAGANSGGNIAYFSPNYTPPVGSTVTGAFLPSALNIYTSGGSDSDRAHINIATRRTDGEIRLFTGSNDLGTASMRVKVDNTNTTVYNNLIVDTGFIGVGTSSSTYKLDVNGTARITDTLNVDGSSNSTSIISGGTGNIPLAVESTTALAMIKLSDSTTTTSNNGIFVEGDDFGIKTDDITRVTVDSQGNVGIGTTTPVAPLNIEGSTLGQTVFKVDGTLGELFTVKDNLTGVLFSVNNVSGIPILEVEDTNEVRMGSYQAPASYTSTETTITAAGATTLHTIDSTAYDMAVFEYIVKDGSNLRAGTVQAVWTGTTVEFNETATNDIGNTADVVFSVDASTPGSAKFTATTTTTGWTIKTIVRTI